MRMYDALVALVEFHDGADLEPDQREQVETVRRQLAMFQGIPDGDDVELARRRGAAG